MIFRNITNNAPTNLKNIYNDSEMNESSYAKRLNSTDSHHNRRLHRILLSSHPATSLTTEPVPIGLQKTERESGQQKWRNQHSYAMLCSFTRRGWVQPTVSAPHRCIKFRESQAYLFQLITFVFLSVACKHQNEYNRCDTKQSHKTPR